MFYWKSLHLSGIFSFSLIGNITENFNRQILTRYFAPREGCRFFSYVHAFFFFALRFFSLQIVFLFAEFIFFLLFAELEFRCDLRTVLNFRPSNNRMDTQALHSNVLLNYETRILLGIITYCLTYFIARWWILIIIFEFQFVQFIVIF